MAADNKYWYFRFTSNFFQEPEIRGLRVLGNVWGTNTGRGPMGDTFLIMLLELMIQSLPYRGRIMLAATFPATKKAIPNLLNAYKPEEVNNFIIAATQTGAIEETENGAYIIPMLPRLIGKSSKEADKKRAYRSKKEESTAAGAVGTNNPQKQGQMSDRVYSIEYRANSNRVESKERGENNRGAGEREGTPQPPPIEEPQRQEVPPCILEVMKRKPAID